MSNKSSGLTIPLQFDIRVVAEDAKLALSFNRRGVLPELNSPILVPRMVGLSRGMELLITGRTFLGREAAEWGLASEALPADPRGEVEPVRSVVAQRAPAALRATRRRAPSRGPVRKALQAPQALEVRSKKRNPDHAMRKMPETL